VSTKLAARQLPECWLLVQWPPGQDEPTDYWLSDLPTDTPLAELVRLAKSCWRIEHDYRELKTGLGLDHFEGRSWNGWHRHVTLTAAAQLFVTQLQMAPKSGRADLSLYTVLRELQYQLANSGSALSVTN
jgi:SRSO17 transposase